MGGKFSKGYSFFKKASCLGDKLQENQNIILPAEHSLELIGDHNSFVTKIEISNKSESARLNRKLEFRTVLPPLGLSGERQEFTFSC